MRRYLHVAEYYDFEYAGSRMLQQDVPFFLGQLPRRRQTVLELCVGTGRAAIPIAQAGHRVVGVDYAKDMLRIARRKRDAVGLSDRQLELRHEHVLKLELGRRFDWVCFFFNTFLSFATLEQQDRLLQLIRRHLKPGGRFWLDVFNPDLAVVAGNKIEDLEPTAFFVPQYNRSVLRTTTILRTDCQTERVIFQYRWFDDTGKEHRETSELDLVLLFPREVQLLLERNGLRIEKLWGNYDGSPLKLGCPRIIARCVRATPPLRAKGRRC